MDNNKNDVCCSNCKNKIDNGNTFCSNCGNVIVWDKDDKRVQNINNIEDENKLLINNCSSENDNVSDKQSDGKGMAIVSFLIFYIFFFPYVIQVVDFFFNSSKRNDEVYRLFLFLGAISNIIFAIISCILGCCAIIKYNRYGDKNHKVRKFLNIINIISLCLMGLHLILICFVFFDLSH